MPPPWRRSRASHRSGCCSRRARSRASRPTFRCPRFEAGFGAWPIPEAITSAWYLTGDGRLGDEADPQASSAEYLALPDAIPPTFFDEPSGNLWSVDVEYDWQEGGLGTYAAWATDPLADETVVIGSGSVDLYVQSNLGDTDLEVTISEIRPDGEEMYVQSGWLRASHRTLNESESTELRPVHDHLEADASPLPEGEYELVRVELFPFAHVFRSGSRIRLVVDAPGGNRPVWEFDTIAGGERVTIGLGTPAAVAAGAPGGADDRRPGRVPGVRRPARPALPHVRPPLTRHDRDPRCDVCESTRRLDRSGRRAR